MPDPVCFSPATDCSDGADVIDELVLGSDSECLEACRGEGGCAWFTFDGAESACALLADCPAPEEDECQVFFLKLFYTKYEVVCISGSI